MRRRIAWHEKISFFLFSIPFIYRCDNHYSPLTPYKSPPPYPLILPLFFSKQLFLKNLPLPFFIFSFLKPNGFKSPSLNHHYHSTLRSFLLHIPPLLPSPLKISKKIQKNTKKQSITVASQGKQRGWSRDENYNELRVQLFFARIERP